MKRRIIAILDQHCAEENEKIRRGIDGRGKAQVGVQFPLRPYRLQVLLPRFLMSPRHTSACCPWLLFCVNPS